MSKTLSIDLRERVLRHVLDGNSRRGAAKQFAVSASSAVRIVARHAATGSVAPKKGPRGRRSKLEPHRDFLTRRIAETPDVTMPELAAELAALGTHIDPSNLSRWFIRNGYRFKKNAAGQRTGSA
jgi:transposase